MPLTASSLCSRSSTSPAASARAKASTICDSWKASSVEIAPSPTASAIAAMAGARSAAVRSGGNAKSLARLRRGATIRLTQSRIAAMLPSSAMLTALLARAPPKRSNICSTITVSLLRLPRGRPAGLPDSPRMKCPCASRSPEPALPRSSKSGPVFSCFGSKFSGIGILLCWISRQPIRIEMPCTISHFYVFVKNKKGTNSLPRQTKNIPSHDHPSEGALSAAAPSFANRRGWPALATAGRSPKALAWAGGEDFALADVVGAADDAFRFHALDDAGGAVVADLQMALDEAGRGLALAGDQRHGLVVEAVAGAGVFVALAGLERTLIVLGDLVDVVGLGVALQMRDDALDLLVRDERAVDPGHPSAAGHVQHVAAAEELFRPALA